MSVDTRVASRYAKSLLSLANEQGKLQEVHQDMQLLGVTCQSSRELVMVLQNPIIKHDKKKSILKAVFDGKVNAMTMAIFDIICRKNRENILPAVASAFEKQYNEHKGIEKATVTTAVEIDKNLRESFENMVKGISKGKTVELDEVMDKDIIGGYVLRVGDRQIDDSIKSKINELGLNFKIK